MNAFAVSDGQGCFISSSETREKRRAMKNLMIMVSLFWILGGGWFVGFPSIQVDLASATSTFTNSTVESIDPNGGSLRIRTHDGNAWTLPVSNAELIKELHQGDHVSLELDVKGQVVKVVKLTS
jgi:hypothetical protein